MPEADATTPLLATAESSKAPVSTTSGDLATDVEVQDPTAEADPADDDASPSSLSYGDLLEKYPVIVKAVTAFFILGLGDLAAQGIEHILGTNASTGVDWARTARFGGAGFVGTPWAHYYFYYLDYYLPPTDDPWTKTTILKLVIDQGVQAPAILALMIASLAILKGQGFHGAFTDLRHSYVDALVANWKLWIPASLLNMAFVQPAYRVLYVNVVFFLWIIILSLMLNTTNS